MIASATKVMHARNKSSNPIGAASPRGMLPSAVLTVTQFISFYCKSGANGMADSVKPVIIHPRPVSLDFCILIPRGILLATWHQRSLSVSSLYSLSLFTILSFMLQAYSRCGLEYRAVFPVHALALHAESRLHVHRLYNVQN